MGGTEAGSAISNNFALTIFGGVFAGMLVVLICEVQKYITAKASVEEYIFYQAFYLYQALFLMKQNICDYQRNTEAGVPDNLLDETSRMIQSEIFALQSTDYAPFKQKNLLLTAHQKFCRETAIDFQSILKGCNAVKIAINKVKINYLRQNVLNSFDEDIKVFARACLKNHSCQLHASLCGIFVPHSVNVAHYASLIRVKSPTSSWTLVVQEA